MRHARAGFEPAECVAAAAAAALLLLLLLLWLLAEWRRRAQGHQRRENQDLPARIALHTLPYMHAPPSTHQLHAPIAASMHSSCHFLSIGRASLYNLTIPAAN